MGYPSIFIYIILLIGIPLAMVRPQFTFLALMFLLVSLSSEELTFTRLPQLGSYFNARDALSLVAIFCLIGNTFKTRKLFIPHIVTAILFILLVGFALGNSNTEDTYILLRTLRWALTLPIFMLISANLINEEKYLIWLIRVLLIGAIFASVQHLLFFVGGIVDGRAPESLRSLAFADTSIIVLFITGLIYGNIAPNNSVRNYYIPIMILFLVTILSYQTRSVTFSAILTLAIGIFFFSNRSSQFLGRALFSIAFTSIIVLALSSFSETTTIFDRYSNLSDQSRETTGMFELEVFLRGNPFIGTGMIIDEQLAESEKETYENAPAKGHLGHVSILTQFGLVGYVIYYLILPKQVISRGLIYARSSNSAFRFLGILIVMTMISQWTMHLMSSGFTAWGHHTTGVIFGIPLAPVFIPKRELVQKIPNQLTQ